MNWFEKLTGFQEESPEQVRQNLELRETRLHSKINGKSWQYGKLEIPTLAELRRQTSLFETESKLTSVRELVADVQTLHCDPVNNGAMFQVASQFNLLEMVSPNRVPEDGIGIYEHDFTQGPACAIAAGAGTIYRNYFVPVKGQIGQTSENQIDCLADIGKQLGNIDQQLWEMVNGYALPSSSGLESINERLKSLNESSRDVLRTMLHIGIQYDTEVSLIEKSFSVSQAYCSAMPVAYSEHSSEQWKEFATLILEAAYEATICGAIRNTARTLNNTLYLTLLGGGAFGNKTEWILNSIQRAISIYYDCGLDIAIVSYGQSNPKVKQLAQKLDRLVKEKNC